jgi:hypothetical protein
LVEKRPVWACDVPARRETESKAMTIFFSISENLEFMK